MRVSNAIEHKSEIAHEPQRWKKIRGGSCRRRVNNLTPRRINVFLREITSYARFAWCHEAASRTAIGSIIIGFTRSAARILRLIAIYRVVSVDEHVGLGFRLLRLFRV